MGEATRGKSNKPKLTRKFAEKFKLTLPLDEAVLIKPNLQGYLANLIADAAHKRGHPVRVVAGTKIIEVSSEQLSQERKILGGVELDDVDSAYK